MKEKLQELLDRENLRPGQLAERLDVNPASISHILKGRNKPGIEFLQKILRAFPKLNPDWLLLDSAQYERDDASGSSGAAPAGYSSGIPGDPGVGGISGQPTAATTSAPRGAGAATASANPTLFGSSAGNGSFATAPNGQPIPTSAGSGPASASAPAAAPATEKEVKRVIVLYTDNTFESYTPTAR